MTPHRLRQLQTKSAEATPYEVRTMAYLVVNIWDVLCLRNTENRVLKDRHGELLDRLLKRTRQRNKLKSSRDFWRALTIVVSTLFLLFIW